MKRICVFCGSKFGNRPAYARAAETLGILFAREQIELVYGGGDVGLMGRIADTVLDNGGSVTGVIPEFLTRLELANRRITRLIPVASMHERKAKMADLADAFIALPGGIGTLDELAEIITWSQLGLHCKPCGLLNIEGFFDHLMAYIDHTVVEGFFKPEDRERIIIETDAERLIARIKDWDPSAHPGIDKERIAEDRRKGCR